MQKVLRGKMRDPIPVRLYDQQRTAVDYLSRTNHDIGPCKLIKVAVDLLIHLAQLNAGQIPLANQVRLHRAIVPARLAKKRRR